MTSDDEVSSTSENEFRTSSSYVSDDQGPPIPINDAYSGENEASNEMRAAPTFKEKIHCWVLENISVLTRKAVEDLLNILHSEGHPEIPKSSKTLLKVKDRSEGVRPMLCSDDHFGWFQYYSIEKSLQKIICRNSDYTENQISLLINIDGLPIHSQSRNVFWTIYGKIWHKEYNTQPFLIGIHQGYSKPVSAVDFLEEFIKEANTLIENGVNVGNTKFKIKVLKIDYFHA